MTGSPAPVPVNYSRILPDGWGLYAGLHSRNPDLRSRAITVVTELGTIAPSHPHVLGEILRQIDPASVLRLEYLDLPYGSGKFDDHRRKGVVVFGAEPRPLLHIVEITLGSRECSMSQQFTSRLAQSDPSFCTALWAMTVIVRGARDYHAVMTREVTTAHEGAPRSVSPGVSSSRPWGAFRLV